jgi:outer membrane immunogenic protein
MKIALTLSAFLAACGFIYAGPESLSGTEMKQVAPAPPPACPNWTGFYTGVFGGYKFSSVDTDLDLGGGWAPPIAAIIERHQPDNLDNSGGEAGGLIGYNYQWNNWVLGIEAAGGYLWARDSKATGTFDLLEIRNPIEAFNVDNSFKTHYLVTVAPRIGYAFCRWLPFVTGGVAIGDLDYSWSISDVGAISHGLGFLRESGSKSETNAGWMVGGGLEYALTDHWHLRAQYQYIDLGSVEFDTSGVGSFSTAPDFTGHHEAELREHNASFAIIYQF